MVNMVKCVGSGLIMEREVTYIENSLVQCPFCKQFIRGRSIGHNGVYISTHDREKEEEKLPVRIQDAITREVYDQLKEVGLRAYIDSINTTLANHIEDTGEDIMLLSEIIESRTDNTEYLERLEKLEQRVDTMLDTYEDSLSLKESNEEKYREALEILRTCLRAGDNSYLVQYINVVLR